MANNKQGAKKAAKTNRERHGEDFYSRIGKIGGQNGNTGGFASEMVDESGMTGQQRATHYGRIGGKKSKRGKANE